MTNARVQGALIGAMLADVMLAAAITVDPLTLNSPSVPLDFLMAISAAAAGALVGYAYVVVWSKWRGRT
ncbi:MULTISPECIES: hypothetical protein [Mesorhizobium]|uniref:hypothetical protein n=1 Tax=Mesorhizobium TaxID=68287 RepID=UPI000A3FC296|nr:MULTISPECIES: hypothetical protein [Mesorhizobium]MDF3208360.1 hypothetical protein [Mesorhizobium sp. LMG15046]MDF3229068.1 hypothetical protein [Mesorhizobium sp. DSM 30133]RUU22180.1 hypothetical protein EOC84_03450 [Mesorhizobium sp. Primo-B]RUU37910.1 hypothetical protein EOC83_16765 [Mesorhizobium sp. Primo-A]RVB69349.1 hypothetical protein EN895_00840 [Mesorhizobium sp. M7A.F.Ca.CA.002.03.2.1]